MGHVGYVNICMYRYIFAHPYLKFIILFNLVVIVTDWSSRLPEGPKVWNPIIWKTDKSRGGASVIRPKSAYNCCDSDFMSSTNLPDTAVEILHKSSRVPQNSSVRQHRRTSRRPPNPLPEISRRTPFIPPKNPGHRGNSVLFDFADLLLPPRCTLLGIFGWCSLIFSPLRER